MPDTIAQLADLAPGSAEDRALSRRPTARADAEEAYRLLVHPQDPGPVSLPERRAVAAFTALLHAEPAAASHYLDLLAAVAPDLSVPVGRLAERGRGEGPWGRFPEGPLSREDREGLTLRVTDAEAEALGPRLGAALEHAHLLTFHPRDAASGDLARLLDAGWTTPGIVTLSQLVAFLAFQVRVAAGLRALTLSRAILAA